MSQVIRDFAKAFRRFFAPEEISTGAKVTRNVLFSILRSALVWPVPFLLIPFILEKIGTRGYGIWAVFLTIINLTSLADFGLGGTLTKHVAEHYAKRDFVTLKRLLDTGVMLYLALAFITVFVLGLCSGLLVPLLFRGGAGMADQRLLTLWHWLLLVVAINILVIPFYSAITGLQRMDLSNFLSSFNSLAFALLAVLFLGLDTKLEGLLYAASLTAVLTLLIGVGIVWMILPEIRINPFHFNVSEMKHIFAFSLQIYVTQTAFIIQNQIEKLYLAWFASVTPVGWYNIAAEAALRIRRIPELLLTPIMAAASELHALRDDDRLGELYYRAHKYLALLGVPLVAYVAVASKRLIVLWLGPRLMVIAIPFAVLSIVNFFNLTSGPGLLILIGRGNLRPGVYAAALGILVNLIVSFVLIYLHGFSGAVIGTSLAITVGTTYFIYLFNKVSASGWRKPIWHAYLKPVVCSSILVGLLLVIYPLETVNWLGLFVAGIIFLCAYLVGLIAMRFFDQFDLARAERLFPPIRLVRRMIPIA
jgi:O-antigen/teichoic acid export membrane protein